MKLLWFKLDHLSSCVHMPYCYYVIHHYLQPIRVNAIKIFIKKIIFYLNNFFSKNYQVCCLNQISIT